MGLGDESVGEAINELLLLMLSSLSELGCSDAAKVEGNVVDLLGPWAEEAM